MALIVCVFFSWAVILLLVELAVIGAPRNEKLKFFAGFLAILYLALPMLLAGVLDASTLWSFSYFGIWTEIGRQTSGLQTEEGVLIAPLLLNILIFVVLALFIRHRYADIVKARRSMLVRTAAAPPSGLTSH